MLVAACTNDSVSITKLVTSEGIDVDSQFYRNGHTALHQACEQGFMEVVKTLSDLGASVNTKVKCCHEIRYLYSFIWSVY